MSEGYKFESLNDFEKATLASCIRDMTVTLRRYSDKLDASLLNRADARRRVGVLTDVFITLFAVGSELTEKQKFEQLTVSEKGILAGAIDDNLGLLKHAMTLMKNEEAKKHIQEKFDTLVNIFTRLFVVNDAELEIETGEKIELSSS